MRKACLILAIILLVGGYQVQAGCIFNKTSTVQCKDITSSMEEQLQESQSLNFSTINGQVYLNQIFGAEKQAQIFFEFTTQFGYNIYNSEGVSPILVWFQGGPGGPSQFGSWNEMGPFELLSVNGSKPVGLRQYSWSDLGMLLFIDQPLKVGGSWINDPSFNITTTEQASLCLGNFFENFYQEFSSLKQNPLFFIGESYAGHYIPELASDLLKTGFFKSRGINFKGIAIGDGLISAINQLTTYSQYSFQVGIVSGAQQRLMAQRELQFISLEQTQQYKQAMDYNQANLQDYISQVTQVNIQNFMQYAVPAAYPPTFDAWSNWVINQRNMYQISPEVPAAQIPGNDQMFQQFTDSGDIGKSFLQKLLYCIENTNVLLYNGQLDILINSPGVQYMIQNMGWSQFSDWYKTPKQLLKYQGTVYGNYKKYQNFNFAVIYGAGHLVPSDQPFAAHLLIQNFITDQWN